MKVPPNGIPPRWFLWSVLGVLVAILSFIFQFAINNLYVSQARQDAQLVTQGEQIAAMQQEIASMQRDGEFRQEEINTLGQEMNMLERGVVKER